MANTNRVLTMTDELAASTVDAYSFSYYGAKNWRACVVMLLDRGYNTIEAECILRSRLTRYAADDRASARGKATAADLAVVIDKPWAADYTNETVLAQMMPETEKLNSREALRLVWTR